MDFTKFDQATLNVQKMPSVSTVVLTAKAKPDAGDLVELWASTRSGLLAALGSLGIDPATLVPANKNGEDVSLGLQKREIRATFRFQAPAPAKG